MNRLEWRYAMKDDDLSGDVFTDTTRLELTLIIRVAGKDFRERLATVEYADSTQCPDTGHIDDRWRMTMGIHGYSGERDDVMGRAIEHARRNPILADLPVVEPKEVAA